MSRRSATPATLDIGELAGTPLTEFRAALLAQKEALEPKEFWYAYDTLSNVWVLDQLLTGEFRDLNTMIGGRPVADIGGADGDLAFFLESQGLQVDFIDNGPTNNNGLRGVRLVKKARRSKVRIVEADLDAQFRLPRPSYGLIMFLGILYHLQNPYYALQELGRRTEYCALSTKVARFTADRQVHLADAPVAYLVVPEETNNDPTNYWIFSELGLRRILDRTNWDVISMINLGDTDASDPSSAEHDERVFCLLRSRA